MVLIIPVRKVKIVKATVANCRRTVVVTPLISTVVVLVIPLNSEGMFTNLTVPKNLGSFRTLVRRNKGIIMNLEGTSFQGRVGNVSGEVGISGNFLVLGKEVNPLDHVINVGNGIIGVERGQRNRTFIRNYFYRFRGR